MFGLFKKSRYESEVDKLLNLPEVKDAPPIPPVKEPKSNTEVMKDDRSQITIFIDKNLQMQVKSKINKEIVQKLVEEGYILEGQIEDEGAIQLAFILLANEATDQILDQVNEQAEVFDED